MTTPTELLALCMELNKPDFNVFFNYSGHVSPNSMSISVGPGGWEENTSIYFGQIFNEDLCGEAIKWLTEQHEKYRSTQNEVDGNAD